MLIVVVYYLNLKCLRPFPFLIVRINDLEGPGKYKNTKLVTLRVKWRLRGRILIETFVNYT
jgi:hypothetical protein